eukprot:scaffold123773_cov49-Attheya_sp.AAC.1
MSLQSPYIAKVRSPYLKDKDNSPPPFGRTVVQPRVLFHSEDQNEEAHEYIRSQYMTATSPRHTAIPTNQTVSPTSVTTAIYEDGNDDDTSPSNIKLKPIDPRHRIVNDFRKKNTRRKFLAGMMKMILIVVLITIGIRYWFWSSPPSQSLWKNERLETKTMKVHSDSIMSQEIKEQHRAWAKKLPKYAKLKEYNLDGPPGQIHWDWHPTKRLDRFLSVEERAPFGHFPSHFSLCAVYCYQYNQTGHVERSNTTWENGIMLQT